MLWPKNDEALSDVIAKGLWSESETLGDDWSYELLKADGSQFNVLLNKQLQGVVSWQAIGEHNVKNAMMAIAAARHVGIAIEHSIEALGEFISPKRRMELKADINHIKVYDDFAHHPTAIQTTLAGKTVDALIVLHRDHGLDQCVDSPVLIAGIGLHPLTGKRFLVQRFPLLFRRVAVAEDPVQMVTANHPHVQHVFRRHHLFPKHIPVTDGAGDHHGIQPIEIGFCQSIHVFVAELFKMITL